MAGKGNTHSHPYLLLAGREVADMLNTLSHDALASIVVSLLSGGGDRPGEVRDQLLAEVDALHANGLLPYNRLSAKRFPRAVAER
jgi:hypothetical protein